MNKLFFLIITILSFSTFSFASLSELKLTPEEKDWILKHPTITMAEDVHFQPLMLQSSNGTFRGIIPDLYDIIGQKLGINFIYKTHKWNDILQKVQEKKIDVVASMNRNTAIEKGLIPIESPFDHHVIVFAKKNRDINISKDDDIKGLRIAYFGDIVFLDKYLTKMKNEVFLIKTKSPLSAFKEVLDGNADVMIGLNLDSYVLIKNLIAEIKPIYSFRDLHVETVLGIRSDYEILGRILEKAISSLSIVEKEKIMSKWTWVPESEAPLVKKKNRKSFIDLTAKERKWLENNSQITLGTDKNWAPYVIPDENGILTGYDADILNIINQNTGANFQLTVGRWKEILEKAKSKNIDGLSTSASHKKREKYFNFSYPYVSTQRLLVTSNNNSEIESINDLSGKRIGYQEKNLFDKKLVSRFTKSTLVPLNSLEDILDALIIGKIDATIGSHAIIYLSNKKNLPYLKIVQKIPNSTLELVFSIRNDYPEALSILNKGLNSISESEINRLKSKWFFNTTENLNIDNKLKLTNEEQQYLSDKKYITISNLQNLPPFNFNIDGMPLGYTIEYMELMKEKLDIEIKYVSNLGWSKYVDMLSNGTLDVIPHIAVTDERKKYIDYTSFNHITYTTGLAVHKNEDIRSLKDLKGRVVAVTKKSFLHTYLKKNFPDIKLLLTKSTADGISMVGQDKASAVIGSLPSLNYYIQDEWRNNLKSINISDLGISKKTELPMGVTKGNKLLKSILEKAHYSISYHKINELKQKWMFGNVKKEMKNLLTSEEKQYLQNKEIIKMCVLPDWLPFEQIDKNGHHKGIGADLMNIVSKYINTPIKLVPTIQWSESLQNIKDRKCDILPVAMDIPSRRGSMNFTKPYTKEPFVIATKADKLFVKDAQSLNEKKIGIVKSYAFIEVLKQKNPLIEIVDVKNTKEGLEKVRNGELFGYIDTMPTIGYGIQKYSMVDLKIAGKLEFTIDLSVASRNDEPILNSIMQKALNSISEEQKRTIVGKWISIKVEQGVDYSLLWKVIGVAISIFILSILWNRNLRNTNKKIEKSKHEAEKEKEIAQKALKDLKNTQSQLIQSEKLAALGQLIAGVAHEINTPIGAIKSSGNNIDASLSKSLVNLPKIYKLLSPEDEQLFIEFISYTQKEKVLLNSKEERTIVREISDELSKLGIENSRNIASKIMQINVYKEWKKFLPLLKHPDSKFIMDTAYSIAVIKNGTRNINLSVERVSKIIYALKSFSRFDKAENKVSSSIQEGIETVLTIYHNQIKYGVELHTKYADIPKLQCLPDELNQVWTNVIHNALQSMENKGDLYISIDKVDDNCVVVFQDTGCGISDDIREKIFEPFFTTKEVGEGSGLGLDISSKIIQKHNGRIEVKSKVGIGTEFKIILPYNEK